MAAMRDGADVCVICGHRSLTTYLDYPKFRRVTSDCKPFREGGRLSSCDNCGGVQKINDEAWRHNCAEIYADYTLYAQSGGKEQLSFSQSDRSMRNRSGAILAHVADFLPSGDGLRILDYGCGLGAMIWALSDVYPGQLIDGLDTNRGSEAALSKVPGFSRLYSPDTLPSGERWDLITMIHCLEHLPEPITALRRLSADLSDDGCILIQVPDCVTNPFDLVVADHRTHFSETSLRRLLNRAGLRVASIDSNAVSTELTAVAVRDSSIPIRNLWEMAPVFISIHLEWLSAFRQLIEEPVNHGKVGVFGSSIAATWLISHAPERVSHVLDEDPNRTGYRLFGHPIILPNQAPAALDVLLPFPPVVAKKIAGRLSELPLRFRYLVEVETLLVSD